MALNSSLSKHPVVPSTGRAFCGLWTEEEIEIRCTPQHPNEQQQKQRAQRA